MRSWLETCAHPIGAARRLALAFAGILIAGAFFHSWIAIGLVGRGDDLVRSGRTRQAALYFERAARFDLAWQVPVERVGFVATLLGDPVWYRKELRIAGRYLAAHPHDATIRWDRAVAFLHLHDEASAYRDVAFLVREQSTNRQMRDVANRLAARIQGRL